MNTELKNGDFVVIKSLSNDAIVYSSYSTYVGLSKSGKQVLEQNEQFTAVEDGFVAIKADEAKEDAIIRIRSLIGRSGLKFNEVAERCKDL
jgi:hypothetical protein